MKHFVAFILTFRGIINDSLRAIQCTPQIKPLEKCNKNNKNFSLSQDISLFLYLSVWQEPNTYFLKQFNFKSVSELGNLLSKSAFVLK